MTATTVPCVSGTCGPKTHRTDSEDYRKCLAKGSGRGAANRLSSGGHLSASSERIANGNAMQTMRTQRDNPNAFAFSRSLAGGYGGEELADVRQNEFGFVTRQPLAFGAEGDEAGDIAAFEKEHGVDVERSETPGQGANSEAMYEVYGDFDAVVGVVAENSGEPELAKKFTGRGYAVAEAKSRY